MGEATTVMTMDTSSTSDTISLADQQRSTAAPDLKTLHQQAEEEDEPTETDADRPTTPHSLTSTSISSDGDTASTPTQEAARPIFIETVTLHDEPLDDRALSSTSSSQPETPIGPRTPTTPHDLTRDSMASFALSDTSMDWNNLSTETVDDVLATPRVNGARKHLRKVSSLDILANKFAAPERPSTLFDTDGGKDTPGLPMSAIELGQSDKDLDTWRRDSDASSHEYTHAHRPSTATLDSIDMLDQPTPTTDTSMSRNLSIDNRSSDSSGEDVQVDWKALDKNEEQEKEDKATQEGAEDDATAFLLARLEQENAKFAADPKASASKPLHRKTRAYSRPPSMAQLKKLVATSDAPSIRYSLASDTGMPSSPEEAPPMTELEFWVALVQDYPSTASRLPTLTTTKIRSGVPPPLRGVVWASMAGARDRDLEDAYEKLVYEKSPYEGIINKDVGRSFPGVELFRDADGEGQKMLGRVLKCFSLHDKDIGYCQGLGFLVGPLLMNMGERDAFCVLVRLMDHFSLRESFLPSLSGLHMRIYQFSALLKQHHPKLHEHLANHGIEPAYLSQWFLSCFAVTCPLSMLFRIYDVIFAEGANETVMRVALALMRRHEERMLATDEFEEVMSLLLGREMWDCYAGDADELVDDFTSLGDIVTHARLAELEKEFDKQSAEVVGQSAGFLPTVQAAASGFLGRLWAPGHAATPSKPVTNHTHNASTTTLSPETADKTNARGGFFGRPTSFLKRSQSKQDLNDAHDSSSSGDSASTNGSSAVSLASTIITDPDTPTAHDPGMRESVADSVSTKSKADSMYPQTTSMLVSQQRDLQAQIEDLLTAMGEMQREQAQLAAMLQKEREERSEDQKVMRQMVVRLRKDKDDRRRTMPPPPRSQSPLEVPLPKSRPLSVGDWTQVNLDGIEKEAPQKDEMEELVEKAQERLQTSVRFSMSLETKAHLRSTLARTREQLSIAEAQSRDLAIRLEASQSAISAFQDESDDLRSEVKELRLRVADEFKSRQKLEHKIGELNAQTRSIERKERLTRAESLQQVPTLSRIDSSSDARSRKASSSSVPGGSIGGLRELKLGRRDSSSSVQSMRPTTLRNPTPITTDLVPPMLRTGPASPDGTPFATPSPSERTSPTPFAAASEQLAAPGVRRGFSKRTSSLATQEVFATTQHEAVPEEALLLELVNAKTAEAQALQELDEVKKALAVSKRRQEEAMTRMQAEIEAARAEAKLAVEKAEAAKTSAEQETMRLSTLASHAITSPMFSLPSTPFVESSNPLSGNSSGSGKVSPGTITPGEEKTDSDVNVTKRGEDIKPAAAPVGWFWQRRTASKSTNIGPVVEEAK
ncbi:putative Rab-GTPase-TBC domain-containing protein [Septoria linicola]|nr:putative Rab-GTPase-TBC domain-containing protein [Septoria linicola]